MDSSKQALDALLALEAPKEACASLDDVVTNGGPLNANRVVGEAPLEIADEL